MDRGTIRDRTMNNVLYYAVQIIANGTTGQAGAIRRRMQLRVERTCRAEGHFQSLNQGRVKTFFSPKKRKQAGVIHVGRDS